MKKSNFILQARTAIGENKTDDYILQPSKHADEFKTVAPELASLLQSSAIEVITSQYETKDQEALDAQKEFKQIFDRANLLVMVTAILAALVLTVGSLQTLLPSETFAKTIIIILSVLSVISGALASRDLYSIKQGGLLQEWMKSRAAAENKRLEYFRELAGATVQTSKNGIPVDLLKLEYFRRFQLDVQQNFFAKRALDFRRDARNNLSWSGLSIAGAAIVSGLAAVLTSVNINFAAIASLGAIFTALGSYVTLKDQIYQSQRIAERYKLTKDALLDLRKRLDAVREAVLQTGSEPLVNYVDAVHEVLAAEHKQWLGEEEQRSSTLMKLDDLLQQAVARKDSQKQQEQEPEAQEEVIDQHNAPAEEEESEAMLAGT